MSISTADFEDLRRLIKDNSGIDLAPSKEYLVEARLGPLLRDQGLATYRELYEKAVLPANSGLFDSIIDAMTTNETLWFRDAGPWKIFKDTLLPAAAERIESRAASKMRIWCAACSTGQEPYSLAMLISQFVDDRKSPKLTRQSFQITATDISPSALFVAMSGRYDLMAATRGLDPEIQKRFFEEDGTSLVVRPEVKSMVDFQKRNLLEDLSTLGPFDAVLCRNVLIYFDNDTRKSIVSRIAERMNPSAALILGGAESLQGALRYFKLSRSGTALYYIAKEQKEALA